eukprot:700202-Hanusia_phi.AAC.1
MSGDGRRVAWVRVTGMLCNKTLQVLNLETDECQLDKGDWCIINDVSLSGDGKRVAVGIEFRTVQVWNVEKQKILQELKHSQDVTCVSMSGDGKMVASGTEYGRVLVWDIATGTCRQELIGHLETVTSVSMSGDGKSLVSSANDGSIKIWSLSEDGGCWLLQHDLSSFERSLQCFGAEVQEEVLTDDVKWILEKMKEDDERSEGMSEF